MSRYHFDLLDNADLVRDADGREFEDDAAARMGAVQLLAETLSSLGDIGAQTRLFVVAARRAGELEPFAAISARITSLR